MVILGVLATIRRQGPVRLTRLYETSIRLDARRCTRQRAPGTGMSQITGRKVDWMVEGMTRTMSSGMRQKVTGHHRRLQDDRMTNDTVSRLHMDADESWIHHACYP